MTHSINTFQHMNKEAVDVGWNRKILYVTLNSKPTACKYLISHAKRVFNSKDQKEGGKGEIMTVCGTTCLTNYLKMDY